MGARWSRWWADGGWDWDAIQAHAEGNRALIVSSVLDDMRSQPPRCAGGVSTRPLGADFKHCMWRVDKNAGNKNRIVLTGMQECFRCDGPQIFLNAEESAPFLDELSRIRSIDPVKWFVRCNGCGREADSFEGTHAVCGMCLYCGDAHQ